MEICDKCIHKPVCVHSFLEIMSEAIDDEDCKLDSMDKCLHYIDISTVVSNSSDDGEVNGNVNI